MKCQKQFNVLFKQWYPETNKFIIKERKAKNNEFLIEALECQEQWISY